MSARSPRRPGDTAAHAPLEGPTRGDVLRAWAPALLYMALIFALSSFAIQAQLIEELPFKDKLVHTLEYAVLGGLCAYASRRTWPRHAALRTALVGAFLATAFGVTDELHQSFVPGRNADLYDIVADALGASLGAALSAVRDGRRRA